MLGHKKIVKAVIPAAGFGTRMLPATKAVPKELLPVAGKPLIQYAVEEAAASGIETVIIVVRQNESLIQAHFSPNHELEALLQQRGLNECATLAQVLPRSTELQFVRQERPLGLAHAISCAQRLLGNDPFVVLLPDVIMVSAEPVVSQLICAHKEVGASIVAIQEVPTQEVERFGIIRVGQAEMSQSKGLVRVTGLVEKPSALDAPSRLGIFGRYVLEPSIWSAIAQSSPDARGEVQLTDALNLLCQNQPVFGVCFEGRYYDAGDRLGYLRANFEIALQDPSLRRTLTASYFGSTRAL